MSVPRMPYEIATMPQECQEATVRLVRRHAHGPEDLALLLNAIDSGRLVSACAVCGVRRGWTMPGTGSGIGRLRRAACCLALGIPQVEARQPTSPDFSLYRPVEGPNTGESYRPPKCTWR